MVESDLRLRVFSDTRMTDKVLYNDRSPAGI